MKTGKLLKAGTRTDRKAAEHPQKEEKMPYESTDAICKWADIWGAHELRRIHETLGRIFVCADGHVTAWKERD